MTRLKLYEKQFQYACPYDLKFVNYKLRDESDRIQYEYHIENYVNAKFQLYIYLKIKEYKSEVKYITAFINALPHFR